jgi:hypothetical protein
MGKLSKGNASTAGRGEAFAQHFSVHTKIFAANASPSEREIFAEVSKPLFQAWQFPS